MSQKQLNKSNKNKHLTLEERMFIQSMLMKAESFKSIGVAVGKDPTTISKEVRRNRPVRPVDYKRLSTKGEDIEVVSCPLLLRAPYVCNGCSKKRSCRLEKQMYDSKKAQKDYEALLVESREGIALAKPEFWEIDQIVLDGIEKGQHLYHILETHNIKTSQATVYRWLHKGHLSVSKMKFPRVVKFKPRKKNNASATPRVVRVGREYKDFLDFCLSGNITSWIEMDTVIGRIGGKVLLTFTVTSCNFFFAYLLDHHTAQAVTLIFEKLRQDFKSSRVSFGTLFFVLLTDNGSEFSNASAIENDKEVNLFYCDPNRSDQKARIEKNHTLLRDILPKGSSFDHLTQHDINIIASHINSVKRKALNAKSAYDMFSFLYGQDTASLLHICPIPPHDVIQSPRLLETLGKKLFFNN
jgi:transposase, IS30 family